MGHNVGFLDWATFLRSFKIMALMIRTLPEADPRRVAFDRMVAASKLINSGKRVKTAWKDLIDNFGLFSTAYDFHNGYEVEAAEHALTWCKRRELNPPTWVLDALVAIRAGELRPNRRGRRLAAVENSQFLKDVQFYKEVKRSGARLRRT
jgi:hypothetical protein